MELNINNIKDTFFSVLDDYNKYYIYTNKNPEVDEYQNFYLDAKSQLQELTNQLFKLSKNMENNILELNKKNKLLMNKLNKEKEENEELNELLRSLKSSENGSKELINNTKELYNNQYYQNIELFIGILIISLTLLKTKY